MSYYGSSAQAGRMQVTGPHGGTATKTGFRYHPGRDIRRGVHDIERDIRRGWREFEGDVGEGLEELEEEIDKFNFQETLRKIISYAIEGLALATAAYALPKLLRKDSQWSMTQFRDIVMIGLVAAAVFAILDIYAPRIGGAARLGAGLAIGAYQVGGIPTNLRPA